MSAQDFQANHTLRTPGHRLYLWIVFSVSLLVLTVTSVLTGPRLLELNSAYRHSQDAHARAGALADRRDEINREIEEIKSDPAFSTVLAEQEKARTFCEQKGLDEFPLGLVANALQAVDMSDIMQEEADRICPQKLALMELSFEVREAIRAGTTFDCEISTSSMTMTGTINFAPISGFPEGVANDVVDLRIKGATVQGEDTLESRTIDITGVQAHRSEPFTIEVPVFGGAPNKCSLEFVSWWPTDF